MVKQLKSKNISGDSSSSSKITHIHGWEVEEYSNPKLTKPILIEGMPGIGNVGKICMDILIEESKAVLIKSFYSKHLPNSVFVNEENLIDLPKIGLYYKKINNQDFLFLTGDMQPVNEESSYTFCEMISQMMKDYDCNNIVTIGGIGLSVMPDVPKVYITANNKSLLEKSYSQIKKKNIIEKEIYGVVGPIMGVSGLLLGISKKQNLNAYCLLSETFSHPSFIGLKSAKAILEIINNYYSLNLKFKKLDEEISNIDNHINAARDGNSKYKKYGDVNYIG